MRLILLALILIVPLAGCGKKGTPSPPPGDTSVYPRTYPSTPEPSADAAK